MISANRGQAHFTAIGIAAIAEALIAPGHQRRAKGWCLPETLVSSDRAMELAGRFAGAALGAESAPLVAAE